MQSALPQSDTATVARAVALVASHEFVHLNPLVFKACRSVTMHDEPPTPTNRPGPPRLSTWHPHGGVFFTLIKIPDDTIVYCHANDSAYYTHAWMKLASECPPYTAFLGQWCEDELPDGITARLLVFDLYCPEARNANERYTMLRAMQAHLPAPSCILQWSGDRRALKTFLPNLPHKVDAMLGLTDDPLRLERVALPRMCGVGVGLE